MKEANARAREANQTAKDALTESERPWVGPGPIDILTKPTAGQPLTVRVTVVNSGKSPALHVLAQDVLKPIILPAGDLRVPFIGDPMIPECSEPKPQWKNDLGGTIVLPGSTNQSSDIKSPSLNQEIVDVITNKIPTVFTTDEGLKDIPRMTSSPTVRGWVMGLYLVGCFDYFDEFHNAYRTSFCLFYEPSSVPAFPNGVFGSCPKGNSAD